MANFDRNHVRSWPKIATEPWFLSVRYLENGRSELNFQGRLTTRSLHWEKKLQELLRDLTSQLGLIQWKCFSTDQIRVFSRHAAVSDRRIASKYAE